MSLQKTLNTLFDGKVICEVSHPNLTRFLQETEGHDKVVDTLDLFGKKLAVSADGQAYYLAWKDGSKEALREISTTGKERQEELSRMRHFITFMLEVNDSNGRITQGDEVRVGALTKAIDDSASLRDSLKDLASIMRMRSTTDGTRASDLLRKMKDAGYLKLVDAQRQHYLVTAKIQLIYDGFEFFEANIPAVSDAVSRSEHDMKKQEEMF